MQSLFQMFTTIILVGVKYYLRTVNALLSNSTRLP